MSRIIDNENNPTAAATKEQALTMVNQYISPFGVLSAKVNNSPVGFQ